MCCPLLAYMSGCVPFRLLYATSKSPKYSCPFEQSWRDSFGRSQRGVVKLRQKWFDLSWYTPDQKTNKFRGISHVFWNQLYIFLESTFSCCPLLSFVRGYDPPRYVVLCCPLNNFPFRSVCFRPPKHNAFLLWECFFTKMADNFRTFCDFLRFFFLFFYTFFFFFNPNNKKGNYIKKKKKKKLAGWHNGCRNTTTPPCVAANHCIFHFEAISYCRVTFFHYFWSCKGQQRTTHSLFCSHTI